MAKTKPTARAKIGTKFERKSSQGKFQAAEKSSGGKEDEKDNLRIKLRIRKSRNQADQKSGNHAQDRKGKLNLLGHDSQHANDTEKNEKNLDFLDDHRLGQGCRTPTSQVNRRKKLRNILA